MSVEAEPAIGQVADATGIGVTVIRFYEAAQRCGCDVVPHCPEMWPC